MSERGAARLGGEPWQWAWCALLVVVALTRLVDLDSRALSHDESLHAHFSYRLLEYRSYDQHPAYHGPLLYHLAAASFAFFGDSDATARLPVALAAIAAVALLFLFGRYLGRRAAWLAGVLMLISPSMLFYGRYARNDLLIVAVTIGWAYAMLRYLETRERRWLWLVGLCMTLSFASKEVSFITGTIFGMYALAWVIRRPGNRTATTWRVPIAAARDLTVMMLSLVLPFAAGALSFLFGWPVLDDGATETLTRTTLTVSACVVAAAALGLWWFAVAGGRRQAGGPGWKTWLTLFTSFWATLWLLFSGLLANVRVGFVNGTAGSLGYWLEQQEVARGEQPWFYYVMLLALYESLPVLLSIGAVVLIRTRSRSSGRADELDGSGPSDDAATRNAATTSATSPSPRDWQRLVLGFLMWWALVSLIAYSVAAEKMPWLVVHTVLPLLLLGGHAAAQLSRRLVQAIVGDPVVAGLLAIGGLVPISLVMLSGGRPFVAEDAQGVAATMRWLTSLLAVLLLAAAARRLRSRLATGSATRWLIIGVLLMSGIWTVRTAWQANYVNDELATELLVYAHSTPDVNVVLEELDRLASRRSGEPGIEVAYTSAVAWPFAWYLRSLPGARLLDDETPAVGSADVVLSSSTPSDELWAAVMRGYAQRKYRRTWWPVETYRIETLNELWQRMSSPESWRRLREVVLHRRYPGVSLRDWPLREDMSMWVRDDLEPLGESLPFALTNLESRESATLQVVEPTALEVWKGPFSGKALDAPAGISARPQGGWVVADSGNDRILGLDAQGAVDLVIGSADGLALDQPWGVAVSARGDLAIADTWNGRIVFVAKESEPGASTSWRAEDFDPQLGSLYGPREVVFDDSERLAIADTGNGRVLLLERGTDGRLGSTGATISAAERFREPVGLAFRGDSLLVADIGNRTLRFVGASRDLDSISSHRLNAWSAYGSQDRAFLAALASGRILTTEPARGCLLLLEYDGTPSAIVRLPARESGATARPVGVATADDGERELVAVTDIDGDRILVFDARDLEPGS